MLPPMPVLVFSKKTKYQGQKVTLAWFKVKAWVHVQIIDVPRTGGLWKQTPLD